MKKMQVEGLPTFVACGGTGMGCLAIQPREGGGFAILNTNNPSKLLKISARNLAAFFGVVTKTSSWRRDVYQEWGFKLERGRDPKKGDLFLVCNSNDGCRVVASEGEWQEFLKEIGKGQFGELLPGSLQH
ncbi:hypothetical protein A2442_00265 [Candidatus Campbellbacteria bacterium RIFOXYC2_FULL_35_25]|uniref:Uncharacterized protein n=1 Tax=Candidatus Campbellbacteria bacterium RIFOXYC2_FULL_35_25 TaxID=1797582 RepID=A0A1F5EIL4_9BACT|nr:MAG: hypothetical protein A2442_00265 [Candidatus Campbellbacteria bacterium RIFOXYC2_FULL_35_25]